MPFPIDTVRAGQDCYPNVAVGGGVNDAITNHEHATEINLVCYHGIFIFSLQKKVLSISNRTSVQNVI